MDNKFTEARYAIEQARDALRRGDRGQARRYAEHAAALTPQSEDPWLILAVISTLLLMAAHHGLSEHPPAADGGAASHLLQTA